MIVDCVKIISATLLATTGTTTESPPTAVIKESVSAFSKAAAAVLGPIFTETTFAGWLILLGGIFFGLLAGRVVQTVLRRIAEQCKTRGWNLRGSLFQHGAGAANLALFALGLGIGLSGLEGEPKATEKFLGKFVLLLFVLAIGWFIYNLVELIEAALHRLTAHSETKIDDTVVTLLRKALRIFVVILFGLFVVQNVFEQNITTWLAGLGIAGLAVSLAAQDSLKNLFGSIMVLVSRPFGLGDRIIYGMYDGVVENIGFRATKIRTLAGHIVTVPNMKFTDSIVENISARAFLARTMNIGLTYNTPPEKIEEALKLIKGILVEPDIHEPFNVPDRPPRVYFNEMLTDGLNLQITYAYDIKTSGRDLFTYQEHAERVNLKILHALAGAGIDIAFPSRTVYLAGDPKRVPSVQVISASGEPAKS